MSRAWHWTRLNVMFLAEDLAGVKRVIWLYRLGFWAFIIPFAWFAIQAGTIPQGLTSSLLPKSAAGALSQLVWNCSVALAALMVAILCWVAADLFTNRKMILELSERCHAQNALPAVTVPQEPV